MDELQLIPLPGVIAMTRAYNAHVYGNLEATEKFSKLALQLFPEDDLFRRAQASITLEIIHWTRGNLEAARMALCDWMDSVRKAGNIPFLVASAFGLADIQIEQGQLREAIKTYQNAIQLASESGDDAQQLTAHHHLGLAMIFHEMGEDNTAAEHLQIAEKLGEHTTLVDWPYRWRIAQARLLESREDLESALTQLDEARRVYVKNPIPDTRPVAALKAKLYLKQGKLSKAQDWVRERNLTADDEITYLNEFEHLILAKVLMAEYQSSQTILKTLQLLEHLLQLAQAQKRTGCVIEILSNQAKGFQVQGNLPLALATLERALSMAEPEGYLRIFINEGESMRSLIEKLSHLQDHPQKVYANRLLTAFEKPKITQKSASSKQIDLVESLSEREMEVLKLLRSELNGPEIAQHLCVSINTFHTHTKKIFIKLSVNNRRAAIRRAEELNLL